MNSVEQQYLTLIDFSALWFKSLVTYLLPRGRKPWLIRNLTHSVSEIMEQREPPNFRQILRTLRVNNRQPIRQPEKQSPAKYVTLRGFLHI